jgi:hypothetical protein
MPDTQSGVNLVTGEKDRISAQAKSDRNADLSRDGLETKEKQKERFPYPSAYADLGASPSSISGYHAFVFQVPARFERLLEECVAGEMLYSQLIVESDLVLLPVLLCRSTCNKLHIEFSDTF